MATMIQSSLVTLCLTNDLRIITFEHRKYPPGPVQWSVFDDRKRRCFLGEAMSLATF